MVWYNVFDNFMVELPKTTVKCSSIYVENILGMSRITWQIPSQLLLTYEEIPVRFLERCWPFVLCPSGVCALCSSLPSIWDIHGRQTDVFSVSPDHVSEILRGFPDPPEVRSNTHHDKRNGNIYDWLLGWLIDWLIDWLICVLFFFASTPLQRQCREIAIYKKNQKRKIRRKALIHFLCSGM